MKSKKSLKALVVSVLSLVVCMSLFVGSTFAWFTDSAVGKNQVIKAGNLDMVVTGSTSYQDIAGYTAIESTELFDTAALWEPGHVEYAYVNIANVGSLALKYDISMYIKNEVSSTNYYGESFKLSNYIEYGIIRGKVDFANDRDAAINAVTAPVKLSEEFYSGEVDLLSGLSHDYTIVVYMPESVGNEANHMTGAVVPSVDFGMVFNATQTMEEEDEFGHDYDGYITMTVKSATAGESITLTDADSVTVGNTAGIDYDAVSANGAGASVTIDGGTYDAGEGASNYTVTAFNGGAVVINDGSFYCNADQNGLANHVVYVSNGSITINGGYFEATVKNTGGSTQDAYPLVNIKDSYRNSVINNGGSITDIISITGGTFVNFNPANNYAEGAGTNFVVDGYTVVAKTQANGDIWFVVVADADVAAWEAEGYVEDVTTALAK